MTRLTLCLLASTTLCAPTLALADNPISDFLSRAADEVRDSVDRADASGWRNDSRGGRGGRGDDDDDDDDDRGGWGGDNDDDDDDEDDD